MKPVVDFQLATPDPTELPGRADFERWVAAALAGRTGYDSPELTIRVVDEPESAELNGTYRGKSGPTNVLSFPAELPPEVESGFLGDLVICAPVVLREAREQNKAAEAHWAHLTVHGCLHLLGHDHQEDAEAEAMEVLETAILADLGYEDPYAVKE